MNMKVLKLYTHWSPEEADTIIDFLDTFRDELLVHYGESIIQMRTSALAATNSDQTEMDFDDEIEI